MNRWALAVLFFLLDRFTGVCGAGRFDRGVLAVGVWVLRELYVVLCVTIL